MQKMQPGQNGPARFVGEFDIGIGEHISWDLTPEPGDVALVHVTTEQYGRTDYVQIRCAICGTPDLLPLQQYREGGNPSWRLTAREPVNVEPSIRCVLGPLPDGKTLTCHYFIHGGRFETLSDSTPRGT